MVKVKDILNLYSVGCINAVKIFLNETKVQVDPSSWCGYIKQSLTDGHEISTSIEIELLIEKFNLLKNV